MAASTLYSDLRFAVIAYTDETGPVAEEHRSPLKGKSALRVSVKPLSLSLLIYSFDGASVRILHQYTDLCALKLINGPILTLILDSSSESTKREALFLSWNKEVSRVELSHYSRLHSRLQLMWCGLIQLILWLQLCFVLKSSSTK